MVLGVCRRMLPALARCGGRLPGDVPRPGAAGRVDRPAGATGELALRRRRADRQGGPAPGRAQRAAERRLMDVPKVRVGTPDDRDDLLPILDEELNRLPQRYRAALVACELEGKSRREAARELGIPEGTLSTHLARGRKLLRERLRRRGVSLGVGPIAGSGPPARRDAVPERLMGPTVRRRVGLLGNRRAGATATVSSLAERVLKMMFLARLTLVVAALMTAAAGAMTAVVLALPTSVAQAPPVDPPQAGPDDLAGRVVDRAGAGVADVQVWGWWAFPNTADRRDGDDRRPGPVRPAEGGPPHRAELRPDPESVRPRPDGRVGWHQPEADGPIPGTSRSSCWPSATPGAGSPTRTASPSAGVVVDAALFWCGPTSMASGSAPRSRPSVPDHDRSRRVVRAEGRPPGHPDHREARRLGLRLADGPLGCHPGGGHRPRRPPGSDQGPAPAVRGARNLAVVSPSRGRVRRGPGPSPSGPFALQVSKDAETAPDGTFEFDGLPPGRYVVNAYFEEDGIIAGRPETEVEVAPGGVATVEIALRKLPKISGRIVDAKTGRGIAAAKIHALLREAGKRSTGSSARPRPMPMVDTRSRRGRGISSSNSPACRRPISCRTGKTGPPGRSMPTGPPPT